GETGRVGGGEVGCWWGRRAGVRAIAAGLRDPDPVGSGPAIQEELIDRMSDLVVEHLAGVQSAELAFVVAETEDADRLAGSARLVRVRVADEDGDRRRRRGDRVGGAGQLLDVDARVAERDWHGEAGPCQRGERE